MDTYITLVVLGNEYAVDLKERLDAAGIIYKCVDIDLGTNKGGTEFLVRTIDLARAVSVLEGSVKRNINSEDKIAGMGSELLIPVDFSESSFLACKVGFELAKRLNLRPVLLHSYAPSAVVPFKEDLISTDKNSHISDSSRDNYSKARNQMSAFCIRLHKAQREGEIVGCTFSTVLRQGIPEESIIVYIKNCSPALVVMATRGKDKKEEELIGSVTAEVLDSCRVPVFTVPENYNFESIESIVRLALFCNIDRHDVSAVDSLMRLFDFPEISISLIPVDDRKSMRVNEKIADICGYLTEYYNNATFETKILDQKKFREQLEKHIHEKNLQLLIVPNKKTHIFSRIFKPTMAHRFLFERDMPMLVLPV